MKTIGIIVTSMSFFALSCLYSGFALSVLWGWFIVPTFNLPALNIASAIGISLIVSYLTHQVDTNKKDERPHHEQFIANVIFALLKPTIALAFGWIIKAWV